MNELQKNPNKNQLSEKIVSSQSKIKWRKPSKFPGILATRLVEEFQKMPQINYAYICELSCEHDGDKFLPLIAIDCEHPSATGTENLISHVCEIIARCPGLDQAFNVCIIHQVPEVRKAISEGLSRLLFTRKT